MHDVIANIKLSDVMTEQSRSELVNSHVIAVQSEPGPDFEAMRKAVDGETEASDGNQTKFEVDS